MPNILFMSHQINAGATTIAADTFTRTNSTTTVGASTETGAKTYTAANGTWGINTNQLYVPSSPSGDGLLTFDSGISDFTYQTTYANVGPSNTNFTMAAMFRYQDTSHCYVVWAMPFSTNYQLVVKNGGDTTLGTGGSTPVNGDIVKIVTSGTSIKVSVNGTQIISVTDGTFTAKTVCGFRTGNWSTGLRFDTMSLTSP